MDRLGDTSSLNVASTDKSEPLRILAVSALWQGANDYAFVRAFRRAGHSVAVVSEEQVLPRWESGGLRTARRLLLGRIAQEFNRALLSAAQRLRPDLLFVFKGALVSAETLRRIGELGCIRIQFYPDTGFRAQSSHLWEAIRHYDWVFSTKPDHPRLLRDERGVDAVSFLPHAFDPETHFPPRLSLRDRAQYECDISFVGNISTKKSRVLADLLDRAKDRDLRIWGPNAWRSAPRLATAYQGAPVFGLEYAKVLNLSKVNLGLLFEGSGDGGRADVLTSRTFHIPASGGFMLHERTDEVRELFQEDKECAYFSDTDELADKISYYLSHEEARARIAEAGRQRCLSSGYSVDDRAMAVVTKYYQLRSGGLLSPDRRAGLSGE